MNKIIPSTMRKGEFAAHIGVRPCYVSELIKAGRIILEGKGKFATVKVKESIALIESTQGGRIDVAHRHAEARKSKSNSTHDYKTEETPKRKTENADPETLVDAKTRKESAQADQEEMKAAQMAGNLIAREDVDAAMRFLGASVRAAMDVFPDQTAPVLCGVIDLNETHAILTDSCRNVLHDIGVAIERQQKQLSRMS